MITARRVGWLIVLVAALSGCRTQRHTPEQLRLHCLALAHKTVKVSESDSSNRQPMVRELYLRCLDSYGIPDALPKSGSE